MIILDFISIMPPSVSTIIVTWNNYIDTKECIISLKNVVYKNIKIILVDNGSYDGSVEQLKNEFINDEIIHFIHNKQNYGFAKGINVGIKQALQLKAKYILILNQDTIVEPQLIDECLKVMADNPKIGIVGPRIYYHSPPNKVLQSGGYFNLFKGGFINLEKDKYDFNCDNNIKKVTTLSGCAMFVRKEVFEKVGLFDEDYFFYSEDVDFSLRVQRAGFEMRYVPTAKVWHKISSISKDRTNPFVLYNRAKSHIIFLRKNFPFYYFLYGLILHLLLYTPFRMFQIVKSSNSWKTTWAWFLGTWEGFWQPLHRIKF